MALSQNLERSDHSLVADLYKNYAPAILNYLCRQLPIREDAEDVLLEVFQAALESNRLSDLDPNHQVAWLWGVARNKSRDHLRRAYKLPGVPLDDYADALYADELATPEAVALRRETHTGLRRQLAMLSEQQQRVLLLRFGYDLRGPEIAAHLNKNEGAVRALLSRTLNHLRNLYSQSEEENANA
jgi:RNA polymerase sigma factor (sigma-70 family)